MGSEPIGDLRARLELLRELGVAEHDPSTGRVVFFVPRAPAVTKETTLEVEASRARATETAEQRRRFGASGGFQPGQETQEDRMRRQDAAREARQVQKVRAARAELDGGTG